MAEIISGTEKYGTGKEYVKPSSGDDGVTWASLIETFMERMALHTHDGSDSESIAFNIAKAETLIPTLNMTLVAGRPGVYESAVINFEPNVGADNVMKFYELNGSYYQEFFPTVEILSNTTFQIKTNKPSAISNVRIYYF